MEQYINKAKIVAEIENLFKKAEKSSGEYRNGAMHTLITLKNELDTFETKEVDLEEEVANWWNEHYADIKKGYTFEGYTGHYMENPTIIILAKHFYELGQLNTRNKR